MAIFMRFANTIKGDVATPQYKDWIRCGSINFGYTVPFKAPTASGSNRLGAHASVSEIHISKDHDPATVLMWQAGLAGKIQPEVYIAFTLANQDNAEYLRIRLEHVGISSWQTSSSGDRPTETISLNFTRIEIRDAQQSPNGSIENTQSAIYDLILQTTF